MHPHQREKSQCISVPASCISQSTSLNDLSLGSVSRSHEGNQISTLTKGTATPLQNLCLGELMSHSHYHRPLSQSTTIYS